MSNYEAFELVEDDFVPGTRYWNDEENEPIGEPGWYWWYCEPGCLPTCDQPHGPFDTEEQAITNAEEDQA